MSSTATTLQLNRAPLRYSGLRTPHRGCAGDESATAV